MGEVAERRDGYTLRREVSPRLLAKRRLARAGGQGHDCREELENVSENPTHALNALSVGAPDPELLALPAPPKEGRWFTIAVMSMTAVAAAALALSLHSEAKYALSPGEPIELGDLTMVELTGTLDNKYVRGTGMLGSHGAIRYGRAAEGDSYRLAPLAGHDDLWVEIRVPEGFEGPRFIPPTTFAGRLVPIGRAGLRHQGLPAAVEDKAGVAVPEGAWILIDGSSPRASRWALAMMIVLIGFASWNVVSAGKLLARVRDRDAPRPPTDGPEDDGDEPRSAAT